MTTPIRRAGVIGAGVMGSGIAAHFANAGVEVVLLDIVPPNLEEAEKGVRAARNRFADGGLKNALKAKPAAFFHKSGAALVKTGNLEDDLNLLADCDLVIEAIIEQLDAKRALLEKLEGVIKSDAIVASNTSGLRIADMLQGRSESLQERFLVMHFFNPVRYMKLLELVAGPKTKPEVMERVSHFGRESLGKGLVIGKDTPNFVGNRIGVHSMLLTTHLMLEQGLSPEDVDAITGPPMAHPRSASFRTADMVGLDTFVHVADNCYEALVDDEEREVFKVPDFLRDMVQRKLLGNKTRGGFYKKERDGILTFDPTTREYRPKAGDPEIKKLCKSIAGYADPGSRVKRLVNAEGKAGTFAWTLLSRAMAYAARRVGEIADSVVAIDEAMRWGYNWELGPFETWDAIGFREAYERMKADGIALPDAVHKMYDSGAQAFYQDGKVFDLGKGDYVAREEDPRERPLEVLRRGEAPVLQNNGAEAWDLGDGVLGVTFKTKANSLDADSIGMLTDAVERAERDFRGMLIYNQGEHFSVGANLLMVAMAANQKQWEQIRQVVKSYQGATQRLKYAHVPVVAAPYGMTLGGGLELCLACDAVQASAETYAGLVEVGVGLLPGGAGNLNLLWRALEGIPEEAEVLIDPFTAQVFKNIALARVSTSAVEAQQLGYFRKTDGVSFDRARQLHEAKARVIGMAEAGYHPPVPRAYKLLGENGIATLSMLVDTLQAGGYASEHDGLIARKIAHVLCGGPAGATHAVTEQELLDLECEAFVSLCGEAKTLERIQHMLTTNKPLRN